MKQDVSDFWKNRNARERLVLATGGLIFCSILFYLYLWSPVYGERQKLLSALPEMRITSERMKIAAVEVERLKAIVSKNALTGSAKNSFKSVLSQSAKANNLEGISIIVKDPTHARVSLKSVSFESFFTWIDIIKKKNGIRVEQLRLETLPGQKHVMVETIFARP